MGKGGDTGGDAPGADAADSLVLNTMDYEKRIVVYCSSSASMSEENRKLLVHSVSVVQFAFAQFYFPEKLSDYEAVFVSKNGVEAAVVRDNQRKYHPQQRCGAWSLEDNLVRQKVKSYELTWGPINTTRFEEVQEWAQGSRTDKTDASAAATDAGASLAFITHPSANCVVVRCTGSVAGTYGRILVHSLTMGQFAIGQFYHPEVMAEYHAVFVSRDGKDAEVARANQLKHHPDQKVSAFALEDKGVVAAIAENEQTWTPAKEKKFRFLELLALSPTADLPGRGRLGALSVQGADVSKRTLDPSVRLALVHVGGAMRATHPKLVQRTVSVAQFLFAQHNHPAAVEEFEAIFLSGDGKEAEVAKANQEKYHPAQMCAAFALGDPGVAAALADFASDWDPIKEADLTRLRLLAVSPQTSAGAAAWSLTPGERPSHFIKGPRGSLLAKGAAPGSLLAETPEAAVAPGDHSRGHAPELSLAPLAGIPEAAEAGQPPEAAAAMRAIEESLDLDDGGDGVTTGGSSGRLGAASMNKQGSFFEGGSFMPSSVPGLGKSGSIMEGIPEMPSLGRGGSIMESMPEMPGGLELGAVPGMAEGMGALEAGMGGLTKSLSFAAPWGGGDDTDSDRKGSLI